MGLIMRPALFLLRNETVLLKDVRNVALVKEEHSFKTDFVKTVFT